MGPRLLPSGLSVTHVLCCGKVSMEGSWLQSLLTLQFLAKQQVPDWNWCFHIYDCHFQWTISIWKSRIYLKAKQVYWGWHFNILQERKCFSFPSLDTELAKWWVIAARRSEFSCWVYEFLFKKNACLKDNPTLFIVTFPNFFCRRQGIAKTLGCCHWNKWKCHIHPFNISKPAYFQFHFKFPFCALLLLPNMKGPRTNALTVALKWNFEFDLHIDWKRIQFICRQQRILLGLWVIKEQELTVSKTNTLFTSYPSI